MLMQRINRSDPEKIFMVVKAQQALLVDRPVSLAFTGTDDGLGARTCDSAVEISSVVGIADSAAAIGEYCLVQVYGFRSSAVCIAATSIAAGGTGCVYVPVHDSSGILSQSISKGASVAALPNFVAANSASTTTFGATSGMAVFIRCL